MTREGATAPLCLVVDCGNLSALTDIAFGRFWYFDGYYCSECYTALSNGEHREIDPSRLHVRPVRERPPPNEG